MLKSQKSLENVISVQFKDCYWVNEVRLILKNYSWEKIGFRISNSLSLSFPAHSLFLSAFFSSTAFISGKKTMLDENDFYSPDKESLNWAESWKESTCICECHLLKDILDVKLWNGHISSWHCKPNT